MQVLFYRIKDSLGISSRYKPIFRNEDNNLFLITGGAEDLSTLPFDAMSGPPESFTGCIRNLHINNILLPLEPENIIGKLNT